MIRPDYYLWREKVKRIYTGVLAVLLSSNAFSEPSLFSQQLAMGTQGQHRSEANKARDQYRHPGATLEFFGIEDGMTVMEIWPGSGWYTEVLAPAMRGHGQLIIATWDPEVKEQASYRYELPKKLDATFAAHPGVYDQVAVEYFSPPESASLGEAESVDAIVTFRNTHGWVSSGLAQDVFNEFARVLKPGGILGLVQHRADEGAEPLVTAKKGYVSESAVREIAAAAGFELVASSDINANPMDTKDYADGVWTLPPGFRLGDVDREKYAAIGESDRMTLLFKKVP